MPSEQASHGTSRRGSPPERGLRAPRLLTVYLSERLIPHHGLAAFDCGVPSLNDWLQRTALTAQAKGVTVTDVWADAGRVVAYYSVSTTAIVSDGLPRGASTGLEVVPGYLLGRLALDLTVHGQGLGERLLEHALERIVRAADEDGGRLVVVDTIDDAAVGFYEHFGFARIPGAMRLFLRVSTAGAAISADDCSLRVPTTARAKTLATAVPAEVANRLRIPVVPNLPRAISRQPDLPAFLCSCGSQLN